MTFERKSLGISPDPAAPITSPRERRTALIQRVARDNGVTFDEIMSSCRRRNVAYARFQAMRELYATTELSTTQIGRIFGRDHTSVCYALGLLSKSEPSDVRRARAQAEKVAAE